MDKILFPDHGYHRRFNPGSRISLVAPENEPGRPAHAGYHRFPRSFLLYQIRNHAEKSFVQG